MGFGDGEFGSGSFGDTLTVEVTRDLVSRLPDHMPNGRGDGNWNLLEPVGDELASFEDEMDKVESAHQVQNATTVAQLKEQGKLVNVYPSGGETLEHYRARVLAEFVLATAEGTIEHLIEGTASILDIDVERVGFDEPSGGENGTVQLTLPSSALDESNLTDTEAADILDRLIPAGYRVDALVRGTFTYITPEDYNNNNHDATKGYDGLDANGDPKDNGGTYAGLVS